LHFSDGLVQAVSQQTPLAQKPVPHCEGVEHAPPWGTGVLVGVEVTVGVLVGVAVVVTVGVLVGVAVGVLVAVAVGVLVGVAVGVWVGVFVGVAVGVLVGVAVGVFVGVKGGTHDTSVGPHNCPADGSGQGTAFPQSLCWHVD
jgi:hypothetical protein